MTCQSSHITEKTQERINESINMVGAFYVLSHMLSLQSQNTFQSGIMFLQQLCINTNVTYMHIFTRGQYQQPRVVEKLRNLRHCSSLHHTFPPLVRLLRHRGLHVFPSTCPCHVCHRTRDSMLLSFSQSHPTYYRKHSATIHPAPTDLFLLDLLPESSV